MATYRKGDRAISICNLPQRKNKCLLVGEGSVWTKVASFSDDEAADLFEKMLEDFLGFKERKWTE